MATAEPRPPPGRHSLCGIPGNGNNRRCRLLPDEPRTAPCRTGNRRTWPSGCFLETGEPCFEIGDQVLRRLQPDMNAQARALRLPCDGRSELLRKGWYQQALIATPG